MSSNKVKIFPDVRTILADSMATEVFNGFVVDVGCHYHAAKENDMPPQAAHFAALDATVHLLAEIITNAVPPQRHGLAVAEVVTELERRLNEKQKESKR